MNTSKTIPWPGAIVKGEQIGIPCVVVRGGTSRGALLRAEHLPSDPLLLERVLLAVFGSPDIRQIDGIGGADPLTSKVGIVGAPSRKDADIDFTFGQVRIAEPRVDFLGNCGNLSAAVGGFAVDEGLVEAVEPISTVRIHLVNTHTVIEERVHVHEGRSAVAGDTEIPGVPGRGARVVIDFGSSVTTLDRGLLPTGKVRECLDTGVGSVEVSIVDGGNPVVFANPEAFGLEGTELPDDFSPSTLAMLEAVRGAAAVRLGLARSDDVARRETPGLPKLYLVCRPRAYVDTSGQRMEVHDMDLVGRGLSMGVPHRAYAVTAAIATGIGANIGGSIVDTAVGEWTGPVLRIGHPSGSMCVEVILSSREGSAVVERAAIERTARRIMEGTVYVPLSRIA